MNTNRVFTCAGCGKSFNSEEELARHLLELGVHSDDFVLRHPVIGMKPDNVSHPAHYTFGDIEVIDYIRDKLTPTEFQGYCEGNVLKYVSRWRHKGGVEDLKKAWTYLGWMIDSAEGEETK